jgi:hypothetical protein
VRISRPCYDKYHRCPGWAGGGMRRAKVKRCENGSLPYLTGRFRLWRFNRCPKCRVVVLPYRVRWADWRWWKWRLHRWLFSSLPYWWRYRIRR